MNDNTSYPIYQSYTITPQQFSGIYIITEPQRNPINTQYSTKVFHSHQRLAKYQNSHRDNQPLQSLSNNCPTEQSIECRGSASYKNDSNSKNMISSIEQMVTQYERQQKQQQNEGKKINMNNILGDNQCGLAVSQQFKIQDLVCGKNKLKSIKCISFDRGRDRVFPRNSFCQKQTSLVQNQQSMEFKKDKYSVQVHLQCQMLIQKITHAKNQNSELQTIGSLLRESKENHSFKDSLKSNKINLLLLKQLIHSRLLTKSQ